ncbi:MAG: HEAT repeat domain-containing protein [Deltaproteobacteria bacterium]|nr:HEAT repeat domain-containing protein [Deltaproteobacteria bacterium]
MTDEHKTDEHKTREELINELRGERQRVLELQKAISNTEELYSRRLEESVSKRVHRNFAIFGVALTAFAIFGAFGFGKYIESSLSESILRTVNDNAQKEIENISRTASEKIDRDLSKVNELLPKIEDKLTATKEEVEKAKMAIDERLASTKAKVQFMGDLLVEDIDRRRRQIHSDLTQELRKFEEARKTAQIESEKIVAKIKAEQKTLEMATVAIRAQLSEKIEILQTLSFDKSAPDADLQRYVANIVLKDLEDAELVKRQKVLKEASRAISDLLAEERLRDDYFEEIRFRILRAVCELGLVTVAVKRVSEPGSWERQTLVLILGALGSPKAIPSLTKILKAKTEPLLLREKAIRSLGAIMVMYPLPIIFPPFGLKLKPPEAYFGIFGISASFTSFSQKLWSDPEIDRWRPRSRPAPSSAEWIKEDVASAEAIVCKIALSSNEARSLRKTAVRLLWVFKSNKASEVASKVLLSEWKIYGDEAIESLSRMQNQTATVTFRDFALISTVDLSLRLRAVEALSKMGTKDALESLMYVLKEAKEPEVRNVAAESIESFKKMRYMLLPKGVP